MKILLIFLAILVITNSQVLGIDFGTQFWKASIISPGKNNIIVENARTGRKTLNAMTFDQGIRHFQEDALSKRLKKPQLSHFYLNKLLRSLDFENPLQGYVFQNGTYYITHNEQNISLEQLVGMILRNIKLLATNQAGSQIKDTVLSIPANWGWKAKLALINAAHIADLSVLGLINENSAAAINFAITRNDTDPINVGFFNLGSHNLQFSIIQFFGYNDPIKGKNIESLRVLSHLVVQDAGGLRVDRQIADYLAEQFMKKHKKDPRINKKSYVKLLHEATDVKQVLSANKQTQAYIQGLMDGIDLQVTVKRQIVEGMQVFKVLNKHLDEAVQKAGITKDQLNSVQMIGGASRIPIIGKIVKQHFDGIQVGSHINGDEAMAFGSTLRAANLSITFRVKQLHFYDGFEKQVKCVIASTQGVIHEQTLFTKDSQHGDKRQISLPTLKDQLKITLFYDQQMIKEYVSENIKQWQSHYNSTSHNFTNDPNIVFNFMLSTTSIVDLKESYVNITYNQTSIKEVDEFVSEQEPVEENKEYNNDNSTNNQEKSPEYKTQEVKTQNSEEIKVQNTEENKTQTSQNQNNSTTTQTQGNKTQEKPKQTPKKKIKKKLKKVTKLVEQYAIQTKKYTIPIKQIFNKYPKYTKQELIQNKKILQKFQKHQNQLKQKAKIRNDLESTLYRLKDNIDEPSLKKFSQENELENLKKVVEQKLSWLDENAWTASKDQFQKEYGQLYKAYEPMYNRTIEYQQRQKAYNKTVEHLSYTYHKTLELNKTHPWLGEMLQSQLKRINDTFEGINDRMQKQMKKALHENPEIYIYQMKQLTEKLREEYYIMKMLPRPKVKKEKVEKPAEQKVEQNKQEKSDEQKTQTNQEKNQEQTKEEQNNSENQSTQNQSNEEQKNNEQQNENQQKDEQEDL